MNSPEKAQCVEWLIQTKSDVQVQKHFKRVYDKTPPTRATVRAWYAKFMATGSVEPKKDDETVADARREIQASRSSSKATLKMAPPSKSDQEKAQCVEWFIETRSDIQVQRNFRRVYSRTPPTRPTVRAWYAKFMETASVDHKKGAGRPSTSDETVERVRQAFLCGPGKSTRSVARELQMAPSTVQQVLRTRLVDHTRKLSAPDTPDDDDEPSDKVIRDDILATGDALAKDGPVSGTS